MVILSHIGYYIIYTNNVMGGIILYRNKRKHAEMEGQKMDAAMNSTRPCTISESIMQSCMEVKNMHEGKTPKRSLSELFPNIEKWSQEETE